MKKLIIPQADYQRIFRTIYSILLHENRKTNHSCVYFSIIGAFILHEHYNLDAKVAMGIASYLINEDKMNVLAFAEKNDNYLKCSENGFHSWIEVNNYIIDFTSPLFPEMIKSMNLDPDTLYKPKMFQKHLNKMCQSTADLKSTGDFYHEKDMIFSDKMVDHFMSTPYNLDLVKICCSWYKKPPHKMDKKMQIGDNHGNLNTVTLSQHNVLGSW